jgi:acetyltransferase EpsM
MNIGLIGINTITEMLINLKNKEVNNVVLYDDDIQKHDKFYFGYFVNKKIKDIEIDFFNKKIDSLHICLGENHLLFKKRIFDQYSSLGIQFPNFIHQSVIMSEMSKFEDGNIISGGVIVGCNTKIGPNNTIWSGSVIEHDSRIHGHSYIGPNVTISGFVEVGECTLIGSGAVILPQIVIGKNCIIGAGSVVTKNVPDGTIVKGNPAK